MAEMRKLYKVRQHRVIDGVCAGVADYLGIDALWVRVGWALLALLGGIGIVAYLIAMYIFPRKEGTDTSQDTTFRQPRLAIGGIVLLVVGVIVFLRLFGIVRYDFWAAWDVAWAILWPLSLIGGGVILVLSYWRQTQAEVKLRRRRQDRMLLGVCSALGEFYNVDPNVIRFIFALTIILSRGIALIVYVIMALLIPSEEPTEPG